MMVKKGAGKERHNCWDAESESLIALLAIRLSIKRGFNKMKITKELNKQYLRKTNSENVGPTPFQRTILNQEGY